MTELIIMIFAVLLIICLAVMALGVWGIYDELSKFNKREDKKPIKFD